MGIFLTHFPLANEKAFELRLDEYKCLSFSYALIVCLSSHAVDF